MRVQCPSTGLAAVLHVAKDGSVEGYVERQQPAASTGAADGSQPAAPLSIVKNSLKKPGKPDKIGTFSGSWQSQISFTTKGGGGERWEVFAAAASKQAGRHPASCPLLTRLPLRHLGPMCMPKLWAVLYDALLYLDPAAAVGGKASRSCIRSPNNAPILMILHKDAN
jgi:hypothetical protein